jgi:DNA recombination protein RmuC
MDIVLLLIGLLVGGGAAWLIMRSRVARLEAEVDHERRTAALQAQSSEQIETRLKAMSADLQKDAREDLDSRRRAIEDWIAPIKESLEKVSTGVQGLEKARAASESALSEQIRSLVDAQARLQTETSTLASALRSTSVRGRWGEVQLKRVVELAGMVPYADFVEQQTLSSEGRTLRPDLIVKLPGGRNIVVDAKVPFDAYVQASNAADETSRQAHLREHTRRIRDHVAQLAARAYWEPFEPTPGFVVLFVPAEPLFHAALEHDPALMEDAARQHVLLVSPASLIALLLSVAEGWRQEVVAESAREVSRRGRELYDRLGTFAGHLLKLRRGLEGAVVAYNDAVGSLERSVLPAARRFPELGIAPTKELPELEPIQQSTRTPQAPELAPRAPLGDGRDVPDAA